MISAVWQDDETCRVTYSGPITAACFADVVMFQDFTSGGVGSAINDVSPGVVDVTFDANGTPGDVIEQGGGDCNIWSPQTIIST